MQRDLTTVIDFGLMDSHTRPVKILVTANPKVKRSALDCELHRISIICLNNPSKVAKHFNLSFVPKLMFAHN